MPDPFKPLGQFCNQILSILERTFLYLTQPAHHSLALSIASDLLRSKSQLVAENVLLRQQLIVLHRQVKKPRFTPSDRLWLVLLASGVQHGKETLLILRPETLHHWHRQGFRLFWKFNSRNRGGRPRLATETIGLIQQMAEENVLWGAERIHGELLKLDIPVATAAIRKYLRLARPPRAPGETWSVFLKNHAKDVWACDFLPVIDLFFRQTFLHRRARLSANHSLEYLGSSHGCLGGPTTPRGHALWSDPTLLDPGPRLLVWRCLRPSVSRQWD